MANLELEGKLIQKLPVQSGVSSRGNWEKQEFLLEFYEGNYPTKAVFNVWGQDKVKELAAIPEGANVKIAFNISSREWNGRWYTDLRAWRIENKNSQSQQSIENQAELEDIPAGFVASTPPPTIEDANSDISDDDLPF